MVELPTIVNNLKYFVETRRFVKSNVGFILLSHLIIFQIKLRQHAVAIPGQGGPGMVNLAAVPVAPLSGNLCMGWGDGCWRTG